MGMLPFEQAVDKRTLRWLGHLQRMPDDTLAKKLLYAWVPSGTRARGGQQKHFRRRAQTLLEDMAKVLPDKFKLMMCKEKPKPPAGVRTRSYRPPPPVETAWVATPAFSKRWLKCSTWTELAKDKFLWNEAADTYLQMKYNNS